MRGRIVRTNRYHVHEGRDRLCPGGVQPAALPADRGHASSGELRRQYAGLRAARHPDWSVRLEAQIVKSRVRHQGQEEVGPAGQAQDSGVRVGA